MNCPRAGDGDLRRFWDDSLSQSTTENATFTRIDTGLRSIETFDVTFTGWHGEEVKAWLNRPTAGTDRTSTCVVEFPGYGGGRGKPHEWLFWAAAGFSHLAVDARGQGGGYMVADTPDRGDRGEPHSPGLLTRGIRDPHGHYLQRLYVDAARAIGCATRAPDVDPESVVTVGTSQGGGLAVVAASLDSRVRGVVAAVPFLADFRLGAAEAKEGPYLEIGAFLAHQPELDDRVFETLSYFSLSSLGQFATAPSIWMACLADGVCPPSTVMAAHAAYGGTAELRINRFGGHEDGRATHSVDALRFIDDLTSSSPSGFNHAQKEQSQ